jgi:hypothetical protein
MTAHSVVSMTRSAVAKVGAQRHAPAILCKGHAKRRQIQSEPSLVLLISSVSRAAESPRFPRATLFLR